MALERGRVAPLDELDDYEVAEGDPDVRGWEVFGSDGQRIGRVDELLVDVVARKVRYLDVEIGAESDAGGRTHVLVPIGYARLEHDDHVIIDGLTRASVASVPVYSPGSLTPDDETRLRTHFDRDYAAGTASSADFYAHDLYDESRFYAGRRGADRRSSALSEAERKQFGEFGRAVEGDGVSPEDDLDHAHGP